MLTNLFVLMLVFTSTICECTFYLHMLDMRQDMYTYSWYTGYKLSGIASHIATQIIEVCDACSTARAKNRDVLVATAAFPRARLVLRGSPSGGYQEAWLAAHAVAQLAQTAHFARCIVSFQFYSWR